MGKITVILIRLFSERISAMLSNRYQKNDKNLKHFIKQSMVFKSLDSIALALSMMKEKNEFIAVVSEEKPIGIFLYKRQNLSNIILNFLNAIESVPELALLVILIPLFGIGVKPTLVASVLYSILPIARNTYFFGL